MSSGKTAGIQLNQWSLSDQFIMEEFNQDNRLIDEAIVSIRSAAQAAAQTAANAASSAQSARTEAAQALAAERATAAQEVAAARSAAASAISTERSTASAEVAAARTAATQAVAAANAAAAQNLAAARTALENQMALVKIKSFTTTSAAQKVDIYMSDIDWNSYFSVHVFFRPLYSDATHSMIYTCGYVNDLTAYCSPCGSSSNSRLNTSELFMHQTGLSSYRTARAFFELKICPSTDGSNTALFLPVQDWFSNVSTHATNSQYYGVLAGITQTQLQQGQAPLTINNVNVLNFAVKGYNASTQGYDAINILAGSQFYVYGVKK